MRTHDHLSEWSTFEKTSFRFFFTYFSFFIIFKNNGTYPLIGSLLVQIKNSLSGFISWVGKTFLGIDKTYFISRTGSGDTTFDWVLIFTIFLTAITSTIIWSVVDKKSKNYNKLLYFLNVAIRFYIGLMLINYGFAKLFKTQFSYPSVIRLMQTYGSSSPMRLAWTFLGFSLGYNIFMGIAELLAVLLLFRRTVLVGAIITLMTTANVMAVNYFYDIPVKITSTHLVLMTLFLIAPNFKRLIKFFFQKENVAIRYLYKPRFKNKVIPKILMGAKYLVIVTSLYGVYQYTFIMYPNYYSKPKIHGTFMVEEFKRNGKELVHFKDSIRWKYIDLSSANYLYIKKMNDEDMFFKHDIDTLKSQIRLTSFKDSTKIYSINYKKIGSIFKFHIIMEKDTLTGKAIHKAEEDFLLMSRGFNWITEYPFNR